MTAAADPPRPRLLLDILQTLEEIGARYAVVGAFAASAYGLTRVTQDIDIVVDLQEEHIGSLARRYPAPRYYADPEQMRASIRLGVMFNVIDGDLGEKADLVPATQDSLCLSVLARRRRHRVEPPGYPPFDVWVARAEDVMIGKLRAWAEGRSRKHETDLYEMLVFRYAGIDPSVPFDEENVDRAAEELGDDVRALWNAVKASARREADRLGKAD